MRPLNEQELANFLRHQDDPVSVHGGGTRRLGAAVGVELDTSALSGVTLYEPGSLTLVAGAGTPLATLEGVMAEARQRLAFEVPDMRKLLGRHGVSTVGGIVAAGASGPRRIQVGACRDHVLGLRFVNGAGVAVKAGGRVMKNVTGLDLSKLLTASHGALGVITEVAFRTQAVPEAEVTLVSPRPLAEGLALLRAALGSAMDVSGAAYAGGTVMIRVEGMAGSVAYRTAGVQTRLGGDWQVVEADASAALWRKVRDVTDFAGRPGAVWRLSVKPGDALAVTGGLDAEAVYDWGGGLIWLLTGPDTDVRAALAGRGHATLVRPAEGMAPTPVFHPETPSLAALTRGIKAKFDPKNILGPGVLG